MNTSELYRLVSEPQEKALDDRVVDMMMMRYVGLMSLQQIGEKYGITKERVRQLIGNTGRGFIPYRRRKLIRKYDALTNSELAVLLGVSENRVTIYRAKFRHAVEPGTVRTGVEAEEKVSKTLASLGFENKLMPHSHGFDILLANGTTIDVKSRSVRSLPPSAKNKGTKIGTWVINIRAKKKGQYVDFFVVLLEMKHIFVIPSNEVTTDTIAISWPPTNKASKWHRFYERFDLLK